MSGLIQPTPGLWQFLQGQGAGGGMKLFTQPVVALECVVAGTSFRHLKEIEPGFAKGQRIHLRREPKNEHDEWAVALYSLEEAHIGYLPRDLNETIARLMDAGKYFYAELQEKEWQGNWLMLKIQVILQE